MRAFAAQVSGEVFDGGVEGGVGVFAGEEREKITTKGVKFVGHSTRPLTLRALDAGMRLVVSRGCKEQEAVTSRLRLCAAGRLLNAGAGRARALVPPADGLGEFVERLGLIVMWLLAMGFGLLGLACRTDTCRIRPFMVPPPVLGRGHGKRAGAAQEDSTEKAEE